MTEDFSKVARERGGGGGEVDVERRTLSRESSDSSEILSDPETESDFTPPSPLPSLSSSPISLTASQQQRVEQCTRIGLVATHKCPSSILTKEDQREMAAIRASLGMLPRKSEAVQDRRWDDRREERESSSRVQRSCSPRGPERTWEVESNAVQYCGISEHSRDLCRGSTAESDGRQECRQWRGESSQCTSAPHCGSEGGWRGGDCTVGSTVNSSCEDKTYSLRDSQSLSANGRFDESDNSRGLQEWSPLDNQELAIKLLNLKEQRQCDRQLARSAPSTRASSRDELRASDCGPPAREGEEQATGTGLTQPGLLPQLNSSMPMYAERLTQHPQRLRLGGTVGRGAQGTGRELHMPLESTGYSQMCVQVGYQHSTEAGRPRGLLGSESGAQSSHDGVGWPTGESRCRVSCEEFGKHFNRQRDRKDHFQENLKTSHLYCSSHPLVLQPASLRPSRLSYTVPSAVPLSPGGHHIISSLLPPSVRPHPQRPAPGSSSYFQQYMTRRQNACPGYLPLPMSHSGWGSLPLPPLPSPPHQHTNICGMPYPRPRPLPHPVRPPHHSWDRGRPTKTYADIHSHK